MFKFKNKNLKFFNQTNKDTQEVRRKKNENVMRKGTSKSNSEYTVR